MNLASLAQELPGKDIGTVDYHAFTKNTVTWNVEDHDSNKLSKEVPLILLSRSDAEVICGREGERIYDYELEGELHEISISYFLATGEGAYKKPADVTSRHRKDVIQARMLVKPIEVYVYDTICEMFNHGAIDREFIDACSLQEDVELTDAEGLVYNACMNQILTELGFPAVLFTNGYTEVGVKIEYAGREVELDDVGNGVAEALGAIAETLDNT